MDRMTASSKLQGRRRRLARRKSGPVSLQFTANEREAVRVLTAAGKTQETLARASGLSIKQFRAALEKDEALQDAWAFGKAERREKRIAELEQQSKNGSTKATELLLRYEHRDAGPSTNQARGDVNISINADSVKAAIDGRKMRAMLQSIRKRGPEVIEGEAMEVVDEPRERDPVKAALRGRTIR
jgi:hypothetical protein